MCLNGLGDPSLISLTRPMTIDDDPRKPSQVPPTNALPPRSMANGPVVYSLPVEVWDEIERELPPGTIGPEVLELERAASRGTGDHRGFVGEINGQLILFSHLRPPLPITISSEEAKFLKLNTAQVSQIIRARNRAFETSTFHAQRGYLGWLMTQRLFIDEHDQLVSKFAGDLRSYGFPLVRLIDPPRDAEPVTDQPTKDFIEGINTFLLRWHLANLAGPYLPVPQSIMLSGEITPDQVASLQQSGGLFYLPDTIPIPSRDELRNYLSRGLSPTKAESEEDPIAGWRKIIRNDNSARTQISRHARIFELQHYWRLIHVRHGASLLRNKGRLHQAMAKYFKLKARTIKADLELVQNRLGANWETRKSPLE